MKKIYAALVFGCFSVALIAEEIITIQSTITGSQEQPKVISIVPWQKPEDPSYFGGEINNLGNVPKDFRSLERDVFARELEYISVVKQAVQK